MKYPLDQAAQTDNIVPNTKQQRTLISSQADEHKKHSGENNTDIAEVLNQDAQEDKEGLVWRKRL